MGSQKKSGLGVAGRPKNKTPSHMLRVSLDGDAVARLEAATGTSVRDWMRNNFNRISDIVLAGGAGSNNEALNQPKPSQAIDQGNVELRSLINALRDDIAAQRQENEDLRKRLLSFIDAQNKSQKKNNEIMIALKTILKESATMTVSERDLVTGSLDKLTKAVEALAVIIETDAGGDDDRL